MNNTCSCILLEAFKFLVFYAMKQAVQIWQWEISWGVCRLWESPCSFSLFFVLPICLYTDQIGSSSCVLPACNVSFLVQEDTSCTHCHCNYSGHGMSVTVTSAAALWNFSGVLWYTFNVNCLEQEEGFSSGSDDELFELHEHLLALFCTPRALHGVDENLAQG